MAVHGGQGGGGQVEADQAGGGPAAAQRREAGTRPAPEVEDHAVGAGGQLRGEDLVYGVWRRLRPARTHVALTAPGGGRPTRALHWRRCTPGRTSRRRAVSG